MSVTLWPSFAFLAASIYATLALLDKIVLDRESFGPIETSALSGIPMLGVFVLVGLVTGNVGIEPSPSAELLVAIGVAMLGGLVYVLSLWTYFLGLEKTDVSRFVPLLSMNVIFVLVLGFVLFGEGFRLIVYAGVFTIFVGTLIISIEDVTTGINLTSRQALVWGLVVAGTDAVFNVVLKFMTGQMTLFAIMLWVGVGGLVSILALVVWHLSRTDADVSAGAVTSLVGVQPLAIVSRGVFLALAFFAIVRALQTGPVSIVVAVVQIDTFLVFFGALVLSRVAPEVLYERTERSVLAQKFFASVLIVGGVVLIQAFTG